MTETITQMIETHPAEVGNDRALLAECIAACMECAQACTACADACLGEQMVADLTTCIRTNLDCADICATTGQVLSRHTGRDSALSRDQLEACMLVCAACGDECGRHAEMHAHCRICEDACRRCEEACRRMLASIT